MAFLSPAHRIDSQRSPSRRLPFRLLLALFAVAAAAVVLALLPRGESRNAPAPAVAVSAAAAPPRADPPLRAPAQPIEAAPVRRKLAAAAPRAAHGSALIEAEATVSARAASADDLSEDAAAAGMTSRAATPEAAEPAQH